MPSYCCVEEKISCLQSMQPFNLALSSSFVTWKRMGSLKANSHFRAWPKPRLGEHAWVWCGPEEKEVYRVPGD